MNTSPESRAMIRAAISAILNCRAPSTYAKAKRKVPCLTHEEYVVALAMVRK